jgi:hypothetical protein
MAFEKFNSAGGYSVGIPPINVIDANGNFYANGYFYANGQPFTGGNGSPGGSNTQVQYNSNGAFQGSSSFTFDQTANLLTISNIDVTGNSNLGSVSNLTILGGSANFYLQTDGTGNLTWAEVDGVDPAGSNTSIQFNDNGVFGGDLFFTYDSSTQTLSVPNLNAGNITGNVSGNANYASFAGNVVNSSQPNITSLGTLVSLNVSGITTSANFVGDGSGLTNINGSNVVGQVQLANTVTNNNQPNITSVGVLSSLTVATDIDANDIQIVSNISGSNLYIANSSLFGGNISVVGSINAATSPLINLGSVANVKILGGTANYYLQTDGTGNLNWTVGPGATPPAGNNTQIQFNNNGVFGADPNFTWNQVTDTLSIAGNLVANSIQIGSGAFEVSTLKTQITTTNSTTANQVLASIDAEDVARVDFDIIATDTTAGIRNSSKITSVYLNGEVLFNEYAGLNINGVLGNFTVGYDAGNIINPASIQLKTTPNSSNLIVYKMMITVYSD